MVKVRINNALHFIVFLLSLVLTMMPASAKTMLTFSTHVAPQSIAYKSTYLLLNEVFNRLGYDFSLQTLPGKRSLKEANSGVFDGEAHRFGGLNDNNDFPNLIKVPEVQQVITNAMFSKTVASLTKPWQQLSKYSVTVPRGSLWLTTMAKQYAKQVQELSTPEQMLNFVKYGRADIAIMSTEAADMLITAEFEGSGIKQIGPVLSSLAIYTYVHKKHKKLVPQIAYTLEQMKLDGSYQRLIQQSRVNQPL